ncbi:MAG: zinc ribbon domain-containing protein [Isosphaeraceae bacterium]|jgi:predicted nucleic acid-binding Zn ribbon protein
MSAAPLKKCPKCGKIGVKRLIGAGAGLIFKGTGFYQTDYKKTQAPKDGGEGKSGAGDSKPAEKTGEGKPVPGENKAAPAKEAKVASPAPKTEIKAKG